jgi:hypothetical protein
MSLASRPLRPLSDSERVKPSPAAKLSLNDIFIRCPHTLALLATGLDIRWVVFDSLPAVGSSYAVRRAVKPTNGNHGTHGSAPVTSIFAS